MKEEGRIALELSITAYHGGEDLEVIPWLCFLDSWNGRDLAEFINHEINPRITAANMPMVANQLWIAPAR